MKTPHPNKQTVEEMMNEAQMLFGAFLTVEASYNGEDISLNAYMTKTLTQAIETAKDEGMKEGLQKSQEVLDEMMETAKREVLQDMKDYTFEACPYEGTMMRAFINNYPLTKDT